MRLAMSTTSAPFEHRAAQAGVTEEFIRAVVQDFYARVRRDATLGPIFNEVIKDWDAHLEKIVSFWLMATRLGSSYQARDFMPAHLNLKSIRPEHLQIWLSLFGRTLSDHPNHAAGEALFDIAQRMGESIVFGLARRDGVSAPSRIPR